MAVCCSSASVRSVVRSVRSSSALAQFFEQPRILDGDDCLAGKTLDQLDLLIGERSYLLPIDSDGPMISLSSSIGTTRNVLAPPSSPRSNSCQMTLLRINRFFCVIGNVNDLLGGNCAPQTCLRAYLKHRLALAKLRECRWGVTCRDLGDARLLVALWVDTNYRHIARSQVLDQARSRTVVLY